MKKIRLSNSGQQIFDNINFIENKINSWIHFPEKFNFIVFLIIGLNLCITVPLAASLNIWIDEAFSLNTTSKGLGYAISHSINFEGQPPLYFAILNLWRILNDSIVFARLFSILCISLTIYTAAVFSRRYLKGIHPGLIAVVVAFHPFSIWAAIEIRMYALAILISALLLLFFFDGFLADTTNRRARLLYGFCAIAGIYTNYLLACLLISHGLTLLFFKRWRSLYYYLVTMAWVVVLLLPILLILFFHVTRLKEILTAYSYSLFDSFKETIEIFIAYISFVDKDLQPLATIQLIQYGLPVILILIALTYRRFITLEKIILWIITLISAVILAIVLYVMKSVHNAPRYAYPIFLVGQVSLLSLLSIVRGSIKQKILICFTVVFLSVSLWSIWSTYSLSAKSGDWKRVSSYIMAREKPDQAILVFPELDILPLSYYYSGINKLVPIPRAMGEESFNLQRILLKDEKEIIAALSQVPGKHQHLWVVSDLKQVIPSYKQRKCDVLRIDFNCHILADFIAKYYSIQHIKYFYKSQVIFLSRKPR